MTTLQPIVEEEFTNFSSSASENGNSSPDYAPSFSPVISTSGTSTSEDEDDRQETKQATTHSLPSYKLVGDNIDKVVKPRHMRIDHQSRSLHYFHTYAVKDRIDFSHLEDKPALLNLDSIDVTALLPTPGDRKAMKRNFGIHVARVLKKRMAYFTHFGSGLERHIQHQYSKEMSTKSEVVSL